MRFFKTSKTTYESNIRDFDFDTMKYKSRYVITHKISEKEWVLFASPILEEKTFRTLFDAKMYADYIEFGIDYDN